MIRFLHVVWPARTLLLALFEVLLIALALGSAALAFWSSGAAGSRAPLDPSRIALALGVCALCTYYFDLYDSTVMADPRESTPRLLQMLGTSCILLALLYYGWPAAGISQAVFLPGAVLAGILLIVLRGLFLVWNHSGRLAYPTLLLGDGPLATALAGEIRRRPELGLKLIGYIRGDAGTAFGGDGNEDAGMRLRSAADFLSLPNLGAWSQAAQHGKPARVKRIIVAFADRRGHLPLEALWELKASGIRIDDGHAIYEAVTGRIPVDALHLGDLLFASAPLKSRRLLAAKRLVSITVAAAALLLAAPLMLAIAVAIRLDSPGHALFRQTRVGLHGRLFQFYKFRSMRQDADSDGVYRPAVPGDRRCTRLGLWLRRTRLDELPQLMNILRGDMDLVGPRPFVPNQEFALADAIPFYRQRWAVRPGATGWAQVHRGYCATLQDNREKLSYDLFYIKHISLGLDALILFQTVKVLLLGRGAR